MLLPSAYSDAIARGVAAAAPPDEPDGAALSLAEVVALVERIHALPGHPCGRWIAHLVGKWSDAQWPPTLVEIVAWHATNDPDPTEELWRRKAPVGQA